MISCDPRTGPPSALSLVNWHRNSDNASSSSRRKREAVAEIRAAARRNALVKGGDHVRVLNFDAPASARVLAEEIPDNQPEQSLLDTVP
jgi:hypothetical protein